MHDPEFATRLFSPASEMWLESRVKIGARTRFDYQQYISALGKFFGQLRLCDIHIGHIRQYQIERSKTCGPVRINHELCALIQILKRANLWGQFQGIYESLPTPNWKPPSTLTDEQENRFFRVASAKPEWRMWYAYALLANNTGLRGCEMRALHRSDIDLIVNKVFVCRVLKTKRSLRNFHLVPAARFAAQILLEIAERKGSILPHHHIFPMRIHKGLWNPDEPMTDCAIGKPWRQMREAAGIPAWFTPHKFRHMVNTKLAEAGVDETTQREILGHEGREMSAWYSSIRDKHKTEAMENALCPKKGASVCGKAPKSLKVYG